jgi:hypothetical protein
LGPNVGPIDQNSGEQKYHAGQVAQPGFDIPCKNQAEDQPTAERDKRNRDERVHLQSGEPLAASEQQS